MTLLATMKSEKKVEEQFTEQSTSKLLVVVDSGTEVHIMPLKWVTKDMRWVTGPSLTLRGAGGQSLRHYGRVQVVLKVQENYISLYFEVVDASKALLSVSAVLDKGWRVDFDPDQPMITKETMKLYLERRGGLYMFEGEVQEARGEQLEGDEVCDVMPIENEPPQMLEAQDLGETDPVAEHLREDVREQVPKAPPREPILGRP